MSDYLMKVLQITSELDGGGVDRLLYDYCSRMIPDIRFDFIVTSKTEGMLEQPLRDLGCNIFHISQIRENTRLYKKQIKQILKKGNYDIVHDHSGYKAIFTMYYAKKYGIKGRIAHSHIAFIPEKLTSKIVRKLITSMTASCATSLYACGNDAAKWMWGEKKFNSGKVHIMTNAINADAFSYSTELREEVRKELGLENKFVIGNVARFSYQKNHEFLLRVFKIIKEKELSAMLLLVGSGELETEIRNQVQQLGLSNSVIFLGIRNDVHNLLNAMDVFLLPSRYEGLPVTLVEAQASSLTSYASDTITKEMKITDYLNFISLSSLPEKWAEIILDKGVLPRSNVFSKISSGNYNINIESEKMKVYYQELVEARD